MESETGTDPLAQAMVDLSAQGMTLAEVSARVGLKPDVCHQRMTRYLENQASSMSVLQMRMLQLRRLEFIIGFLWEQVEAGDLATQGRNVKNLIDTINQITELMDLRKDRLRDEQVRLTQAQTQLVLTAVDAVRLQMLERVVQAAGEDRRDAIVAVWHTGFAETAATAVEENAQAVVKMGEGAGPLALEPVR